MNRLSFKLQRRWFLVAALVGLLSVFLFAGSATPAFAQEFQAFGDASGLSQQPIGVIVARIIRVFLSVLGIIFIVLVLYAGYLWMTAGGNPEKVKKAKNVISRAVIGLVIIMSAFAITQFVLNALLDGGVQGTTTAINAPTGTEPLSGALGAGIIEDHYPFRDATDVARNTSIMVMFKQSMNPASFIDGYDPASEQRSGSLNTDLVRIYETAAGEAETLQADEVVVSVGPNGKNVVFDPVEYLGNKATEINYTVVLRNGIERANGTRATLGRGSTDYEWSFTTSTIVDLTPPQIVSVIPRQDAEEPKNVTIQVRFSEAMNPISSSGKHIPGEGETFENIQVEGMEGSSPERVEGEFLISSGFRVVDFTTTDACGQDPCGGTIYCLPGDETIRTTLRAASVDDNTAPQADLVGNVFPDGLTDASNNSLDGNGDGQACGSASDQIMCENGDPNDNYVWSFDTTDELNVTPPRIQSVSPDIQTSNISPTDDVRLTFEALLKGSSVNSDTISLWPDPSYEMWFSNRTEDLEDPAQTRVSIRHPEFRRPSDRGYDYWPVVTEGVKSAYQICMYPAQDQGSSCNGSTDTPYCCNGIASDTACETSEGNLLPLTLE